MKKNLRKPGITEKVLKYKNGLGLKIAAIALAIGIGNFASVGTISEEKEQQSVTIGILKDLPNDKFENSIPLYSNSKLSLLSSELKDGTIIVTDDNIMDKNSTTYKVYTFNNKGTVVSGYIEAKYLKNAANVTTEHTQIYVVNEKSGANLRLTAEVTPDNKIGSIPHNAVVLGGKHNNWTEVIYLTSESMETGFVSGELLERKSDLFDKSESKIDYIVENDNVLGIDVSGIDEKELRKLLTGELQIPEQIQTRRGHNVEFSQYKHRKPNFVFIKLGASKIFSNELGKGYPTKYKELAAVCEELKVPYGFYYYSTCVNKDEAKKEFTWIKDAIDQLPDRKYNLLPFAIDVEVALAKELPTKKRDKIQQQKDRQYNASVKSVTSAKAELANLLEQTYIGKTQLYTSRNAVDSDLSSMILDVEQYQKELNTGNSHIWFVCPTPNVLHEKSMEKISHYVQSKQIVLDAKINKNPKRDLIDINSIKSNAFQSYIDGTYTKKGLEFAKNNAKRHLQKQYIAQNDMER